MVQQNRLINEFMELVQVDSETKQERKICDVLLGKFRQLGLQAVEDNTASSTGHGAGNIIATLAATPGWEDRDTIYFTAHMDTVVPGKGIKPQLDEDGYIRSDGSTVLGSDDKAGLAAMFEALRLIKEKDIKHSAVEFVITAGEEAGLIGATALNPKDMKAKWGYALDSNRTVGDIAVAAPFQAKVDISIEGKSAHAGVNPEEGISAIQVASKAISRMKLGRIDHETSANIGSFEGKGPTNIVCDHVEIHAEARSIDEQKLLDQLSHMKQVLETTAMEFQANAEFSSSMISGFYFEEKDPIVQTAYRAIRKIGRSPQTFHSGGGSDANIFNGNGIPTVNLAVGYENIHTKQEQMPVTELIKITELVVALIEEAAGPQ